MWRTRVIAGPPPLGRTTSASSQVLAPQVWETIEARSWSSGDQLDSLPLPSVCAWPLRSTTVAEGKMPLMVSNMPVPAASRLLSSDQDSPPS
jgi:hypothetical protein